MQSQNKKYLKYFLSNVKYLVSFLLPYQSRYLGSWACFIDLFKTSGIKSLYYGLSSNLLKEVPGAAIWFGVYNYVKLFLTAPGINDFIIFTILFSYYQK
jgi:hypothetical protein